MGAAVVLRAPSQGLAFKPNITIVVEPMCEKMNFETLASRTAQQLLILFNKYRLLGQANTQLGELPAIELRGQYFAQEGTRIVRTILTIAKDTQYVFTFTSQLE